MKDITGRRHGKLVALYRVGKNEKGLDIWKCHCDCGKERDFSIGDLRGRISCGCMIANGRFKDLSGQSFNGVLILRIFERKKAGTKYLCKCHCGKEFVAIGNHIKSGNTKSCGCLAHKFVYRKTKDRICEVCGENKKLTKDNFREYKPEHFLWVCKKCAKLDHKEYYSKNKNKILMCRKEYRQENIEIIKIRDNEYRKNNKERLKEKLKTRRLYKLKNDPNYRLMVKLRARIKRAIRDFGNSNKVDKTDKLIGCTISFLKEHLQRTAIKNGYKYFDINNYSGKEYHIDHILPCRMFDFSKEENQYICFNWRNLQILSAKENLSKGAKVIHKTQHIKIA